MNEYDDNTNSRDDQAMARLFEIAGPREEIPADVEARVYAEVQREWQARTTGPDGARVYDAVHRSWRKQATRSRAVRWLLPVALAASAILVAIFVSQPEPSSPAVVGTVARVVSPSPGDSAFAPGDPIRVGMTIETAGGEGISFLLTRNESLRLDENSVLRVDGGDRLTLRQGRVYADTGEFIYRDGGLRIDTAFGAVTDIGTQFTVSILEPRLDVAVREGRVDVRRDTDHFVAMSGERLILPAQGDVRVIDVGLTDEFWDWATELAPLFEIEGKSLLDFLKWAARESGRILFFEDSELRMAAMRTDLHGSIEGFAPIEAIESVLATTAFRYRLESNRIIIER